MAVEIAEEAERAAVMAMYEEGWKVVERRPGGGRYYSAIIGPWSVEYRVAQWTRPHLSCGPLCVFPNFKDARRFMLERYQMMPCSTYEMALFSCRFDRSQNKEVWWLTPDSSSDVASHTQRFSALSTLRPGTCLADAVYLESLYDPAQLFVFSD